MPGYRKYRKRYGGYKKRYGGYRKKRYRNSGAMKVAKKALWYAKKNNPMWHHDVQFAANITNAGTITSLSDIAEGGGTEHLRLTEETTLLQCAVKLVFSHNSAAPPGISQIVRAILFRDLDGNAPTVATAADGVLELALTTSLERQDNKKRMFIYYDKMFRLSDDHQNRIVNLKYNMRRVKARYNALGAADRTTGHLYLLLLSSTAADHPTVNGSTRVYGQST